jgi:hypothetical protein
MIDIKKLENRLRQLEWQYNKNKTRSDYLLPIINHYKMLYEQETGKSYVSSNQYMPIIRPKHFCR